MLQIIICWNDIGKVDLIFNSTKSLILLSLFNRFVFFVDHSSLALQKAAWQSYTETGPFANYAVDGKDDTYILWQKSPWWIVDLQSEYLITHMAIRYDVPQGFLYSSFWDTCFNSDTDHSKVYKLQSLQTRISIQVHQLLLLAITLRHVTPSAQVTSPTVNTWRHQGSWALTLPWEGVTSQCTTREARTYLCMK